MAWHDICHVISYRVASCRIVSYHVAPHRTVSYRRVVWNSVASHCIALHSVAYIISYRYVCVCVCVCLCVNEQSLCKPLPCNPSAETALQPMIWCLKSLSGQESSSLEERFLSQHTPASHHLTASRRGQDKRGHHRSPTIPHNQLSSRNVANVAKYFGCVALLRKRKFVPTPSGSRWVIVYLTNEIGTPDPN